MSHRLPVERHPPARPIPFLRYDCDTARISLGGEEEQTLGVFANALFDYNPQDRPVYFRLLAIEAVIFRAVLRTGERIDTAQSLPEVVPWLRLDGDLARQFEQAGGEPIERLRGVTDTYLDLAVAPAFVPPTTTSTG